MYFSTCNLFMRIACCLTSTRRNLKLSLRFRGSLLRILGSATNLLKVLQLRDSPLPGATVQFPPFQHQSCDFNCHWTFFMYSLSVLLPSWAVRMWIFDFALQLNRYSPSEGTSERSMRKAYGCRADVVCVSRWQHLDRSVYGRRTRFCC